MRLVARDVPPRAAWALEQAGLHPLLARLFAGRGVRAADELDDALARLLPPATLLGSADAATLLADAIGAHSRITVVADYDCDGATACAVMLRGLAMLGAERATLGYVVPDRRIHGYGLTPQIVDLAIAQGAEVLVTVDNGIASVDGVAHAQAAGLAVVVTDHHLPARGDAGVVVPEADVVVNPNQPGCAFASKHLAGVGVAFYVLLALRAELRERGEFDAASQPRLDFLLDHVALGTVADVVRLDRNNRCLVAQGLRRIRAGRMQPGIAALFAIAGRDPRQASAGDFGFAIAPRLNAAGRLADMTLGIECLLTDDAGHAQELATLLDGINRERRTLEAGMREDAEAEVERAFALTGSLEAAVAVFDPSFHEGVVGIVASRLKDRLHRPTFVFAVGGDGTLKGSGRSIEGFHLRDALDLVSKRQPGLLLRFGGHAMAAGCTIERSGLDTFRSALQQVAAATLGTSADERAIVHDGPLDAAHFDPQTVRLLDGQVWGAAFDAPLFCDTVDVVSQKLVGDKHLRLALRVGGVMREAIWFGRSEPVGDRVRVAWRLGLDVYEGVERVQMIVVAVE
ncbi:MAG TPA: single-stranded-DNA-specific exonuclease RecJ [Caldimonas sp.]|nr:single-stranded-DNA-specific exonuclease RecJ [Caldimonas sp.]